MPSWTTPSAATVWIRAAREYLVESIYTSLMVPAEAVDQAMADLISMAGKLGPPKVEGIMPVAGRDV